MASVVKCMGIMAGAGLLGGAASSYLVQSKVNNLAMSQVAAHAKDGKIPIGGMTKDGKMWDGQMTVDEFKKNLDKKTKVSSLVTGLMSAAGVAVISGLTLLLRGKIKP